MTDNSFEKTDTLRSLIRMKPSLLMLLRRFGISLGFGNGTVSEVCENAGIDCDTFLAVANFTEGRAWRHFNIDLATLMVYLKNAHSYFLDFALPSIRRKLIDALPMTEQNSVAMLLLRYFDDYSEEVRLHMEFENEYVFPYIRNLLDGVPGGKLGIAEFEARHHSITPKLNELKEIFICHYNGEGNGDLINSALYDIIGTEHELRDHCAIEDSILVPAAQKLDPRVADAPATSAQADPQELTAREREIVRCIARGLSTKEIAQALFLSTHTVTTHRRNICAKLDIHSAPALTVYAIIHKLVDISEIKMQ